MQNIVRGSLVANFGTANQRAMQSVNLKTNVFQFDPKTDFLR